MLNIIAATINSINIASKINRMIASCKTLEQLETTYRYLLLANRYLHCSVSKDLLEKLFKKKVDLIATYKKWGIELDA